MVPNVPIGTNNYSFVYNTDPSDNGTLAITLPYITPTVSMRVIGEMVIAMRMKRVSFRLTPILTLGNTGFRLKLMMGLMR